MSSEQEEAQLSIKDRLNFPYILANQILTFQKSILAEEHSEREIIESIKGFIKLIPNAWKDKEFHNALKKATKTSRTDKRPQISGSVKMSEATCHELGIPAFVEETIIDYYEHFQACIDLLQRRKMLSRVNPIEEIDFVELENFAEAEAPEAGEDNIQG